MARKRARTRNLIERLSIQCQSRAVGIADLPARYRPEGWAPGSQPVCESLIAVTSAVSLLAPAMAELEQASQVTAIDLDSLDSDTDGDVQGTLEPQFADALLENIPAGFDLRQYLETLEQRLIGRAMESPAARWRRRPACLAAPYDAGGKAAQVFDGRQRSGGAGILTSEAAASRCRREPRHSLTSARNLLL